MQERQRVKNRKGKETVRDLTEYPTLWGTESSSSIWEGCRSIREPVSAAVLDGWTDAVPFMGKSLRRGMPKRRNGRWPMIKADRSHGIKRQDGRDIQKVAVPSKASG